MRSHLRIAMLTSVLVTLVTVTTPAQAGSFGVSIATSGFGVSVGIGDWGPYTSDWANPSWSMDYNLALSGYGEWVQIGGLGTVWRPWVSVGWRPYTYGRWVYTTIGWTWVAYEPWGYIPHHYGTWALADFGWVWVPGYTYTCANVVWVRSGGYVGWYARPPWGWSHAARGYSHGYRDGYRDGWNDARYATYVDWHHLGSDNVSNYAVRHTVASRTRVQDHAAPPTAAEVRRRGGVEVPEARLSQRTTTMNGRQITVARPEGVAASIERHASRTAAVALAPAALERRQPLVRAGASSSPAATSPHIEMRDTSSDRRPAAGGRSSTADRSELRGSNAAAERRADDRPESVAGHTTGSQMQGSGVEGPPVGSWRDGRSQGSARPGSVGRAPVATGSHSSPDASRGAAAGVPAGSVNPVTARSEPAADRLRRSPAPSASGATGRLTGDAPGSRQTAARTTRAEPGSSTPGSGARRQTPRRIEPESESPEQQPGPSHPARKP